LIIKSIDKKNHLNKFQQSGHRAEQQMAFYLKRAFQEDNDICVLNDLRLEMNDDVAQIDHLIVHRFGFIIIESKSVTSKISINEHGEWIRHYPTDTDTKGMPSPVHQALRQADFLKNFLMARTDHLLRKSMIFQAAISDFKFEVLVAISDDGIISRAKGLETKEVYKADQITNKVTKIFNQYRDANKNLLSLNINYNFADSSFDKVISYLVRSHKPKTIKNAVTMTSIGHSKQIKTENPKANTTHDHTCKKCSSPNIAIAYGKFGYYFKCTQCNGNTPIKLQCNESSCKPRIRKEKMKFHQECSSCKTSTLYFENKA